MEDDTVTIYGDTEALDLMVLVNEVLQEHGLEFQDISEAGADCVVYKLVELETDEDD